MTRLEYMDALSKALESFGSDIKDEIISDYEEHFNDGLANGKTEEQIIAELGSIEDLVRELKDLKNDNTSDNGRSFENFEKEAKKTFDDFSKAFAGFIGSMAAGVTNGAQKFTDSASGYASSMADSFSDSFGKAAESFGKAADVFADKSAQFAKEVAESYKNNRNESTCERKCDPENGEDPSAEAEDLVMSVSYSDVNEISVEADCADIIVEPSEDGCVHFDCDYDATPSQKLAYRIEYGCEDGKAYAYIKKKSSVSSFFKKITGPEALYVKLPGSVDKVKLASLSGDVELSDVTLDKRADISTMSGDVILNNVSVRDIYASTMSGDVDAVNLTSGIAELKTMSGDVEIDGNVINICTQSTSGDVNVKITGARKVKTTSVSGDVNADLEGIDGYSASVDTKSGDINLYFGSESHEDVKRGSYTFGTGACEVTATSVSGDVTVEA
ncbi:MAG: DUF4097 family beta strand repeat protein [Lachnospiraceae bacterium]|nr:DUF4097 family beta strand repeat protein [Lachnospiraceae bacterium]